MKAPIRNVPTELNRRLDDLEKVSADVDIDAIIQAVLEQIVIPEAKFPDGLNEQFLIYKAGAGGWLARYIDDFRVRGTLFVNSDYSTGDEDATIYFNDTDESLIFDYGDNAFEFSSHVVIDTPGTGTISYLYFRGTTEYLAWDNSNTRFQFSDEVYVSGTYLWIGPATAADKYLSFQDNAGFHSLYWRTAGYYEFTGNDPLYLTGTDLRINSDYASGDVDCNIYFNDTTAHLRWDHGNTRFEFDQSLYIIGGLDVANQATVGDFLSLLNVRTNANFSVNDDYASGDIDSIIYFEGEAYDIRFDHGNDRFEVSTDLYVNGNIISGGLGGYDPICHGNVLICHGNEVVYT